MRTTDLGDAARIELLLAELRLPAVKPVWASLAAQADKEGWPAGRFLAALAEHEIAERSRRRLEHHLAEARLPPGKTLDSFDFEAVPVISKAQVMALAAGDAWLTNGANLLLFGPPGGGKSHLAAALGFALVENGWRVLFTRITDLVQRLQIARRELALEAAIAKLDKFHLLILDDIAYVTKDQAETVAGCRCYRASTPVRPCWDPAYPCCSPLAWVVGAGPSAVPSGEHPPASGRALLGSAVRWYPSPTWGHGHGASGECSPHGGREHGGAPVASPRWFPTSKEAAPMWEEEPSGAGRPRYRA
jgi:DNA replication protein DnaC